MEKSDRSRFEDLTPHPVPLPQGERGVTVILAAYNAEKYLREAVSSILNQTLTDFEFIVIDDGSKDSTLSILQSFNDPRLKIVSRPNKGLTPTLNEGLSLAQGEFVARMDADDVSMPDRFEKQVKFLREHPDVVCVGSRVTTIDPYGSPLQVTDHKLSHVEIEADLLKGIGWSIVHPAAMMRRDAVMKVGGYREQFKTSQDLDLWLRLSEVGKLANLPEPLVQYRQHFESVANTKADEQWRVKSIIVGDAYARRGLTAPEEWPFSRRVPLPIVEQLKRWVWAALKAGNASIARKHAVQVLKRAPLSADSWKVMYCALRGR
jgi:glycosyltransferase involved in cell wall biosynthesis